MIDVTTLADGGQRAEEVAARLVAWLDEARGPGLHRQARAVGSDGSDAEASDQDVAAGDFDEQSGDRQAVAFEARRHGTQFFRIAPLAPLAPGEYMLRLTPQGTGFNYQPGDGFLFGID